MEILKMDYMQPTNQSAGRQARGPDSSAVSGDGQSASQVKASSNAAEISSEELARAAETLEMNFSVQVQLSTDDDTGRNVVRIMTEDGSRLIRQIPPEAALDMAKRAQDGTLDSLIESVV